MTITRNIFSVIITVNILIILDVKFICLHEDEYKNINRKKSGHGSQGAWHQNGLAINRQS
jgi:uncharacterized membrane protein